MEMLELKGVCTDVSNSQGHWEEEHLEAPLMSVRFYQEGKNVEEAGGDAHDKDGNSVDECEVVNSADVEHNLEVAVGLLAASDVVVADNTAGGMNDGWECVHDLHNGSQHDLNLVTSDASLLGEE